MLVIDSLGVDHREADGGAPKEVEGARSQRGYIGTGQTAPNPALLFSDCMSLGKSLNLRNHFLIYETGLLIPHRAPGKLKRRRCRQPTAALPTEAATCGRMRP